MPTQNPLNTNGAHAGTVTDPSLLGAHTSTGGSFPSPTAESYQPMGSA